MNKMGTVIMLALLPSKVMTRTNKVTAAKRPQASELCSSVPMLVSPREGLVPSSLTDLEAFLTH